MNYDYFCVYALTQANTHLLHSLLGIDSDRGSISINTIFAYNSLYLVRFFPPISSCKVFFQKNCVVVLSCNA